MMDLTELKKILKENPHEIEALLDSERSKIFNAPELKILHSKYLTSFWNDRPNKQITYVLWFDESVIEELKFELIHENLNTIITTALKTNTTIHVDEKFECISQSADIIDEDLLIEHSKKQNVIFFFGEEGIDVIVRGKIFPKINFFYDEKDRVRFLKKHHISNLPGCLKEYEVFINEPGINEAFFASKALVARIKPANPPNNILHNKPEKILRDNLLAFLNRNTQHTFSKENELNNQRELDLYTEVEGRKYLIEVKWLGQSVNDDETGFADRVSDYSARQGVTQTLEYIKHLYEEMRFNVHCGYLCVFDVRERKNPIDYRDYNFVSDDLMPYFKRHFIKLEELVLNRN